MQYLLLNYFLGLIREDWDKNFNFSRKKYHTHICISIIEYSKSPKYLREEKNREKKWKKRVAKGRRTRE